MDVPRTEVVVHRRAGPHQQGIGQGIRHVDPTRREAQQLGAQVGQRLGELDLARLEERLQAADEVDLPARRLHPLDRNGVAAADLLGELTEDQKAFNRMLSAVRAIVEHPFRVVKRQFGFVKVRYRGLAKNTGQIVTLFALANLWLARKRLLPLVGEVRP